MFWKLIGKTCLVVTGFFIESRIPLTEKTIPFVEMATKHKIPTQIHVHLAYADIYFIKKVIEKAGGVGDLEKLIKAMETTETTYSLGKMAYETTKIKPYFHSKVRVDPSNPQHKTYPRVFVQPIAQYQNGGKVVYLWEGLV